MYSGFYNPLGTGGVTDYAKRSVLGGRRLGTSYLNSSYNRAYIRGAVPSDSFVKQS